MFRGKLSMLRVVTTWPRVAFSVSRAAGAAVTVTRSVAVPGWRPISREKIWLTWRVTGPSSNRLNPVTVQMTRYCPGGSVVKRYTPVVLLVVEWATPVAMFVALICAFGMTAPLGSFTVPVSCASNVWARSPALQIQKSQMENTAQATRPERTSNTADPLRRARQ